MRISVEEACKRLKDGDVVAVPTETVYGLAASLHQPSAIRNIFSLKKRPVDNPLIIHLPDASHLPYYAADVPPHTQELTDAYWPGPLTLVVPANTSQVPTIVRAGLTTAAFRVPNHPLTRQILHQVGPLVAPSANVSGRPSATAPEHVEEDFGSQFPVVDGGPCIGGVESTILFFQTNCWQIARLGAIPADALQSVLGYSPILYQPVNVLKDNICPGRAYRHYAPSAKLSLTPEPDTSIIVGFSDRIYPNATRVFSLGSSTSPINASHNLYHILRQLDQEGVQSAWVDTNFPREGLWLTLLERLERAASEKAD